MNNSQHLVPDFTEELVGFMIQMMLTIGKFPRAPFALIPISKKEERIFGADAKIEAIAPLYIQFKRSFGFLGSSRSQIIKDRQNLNLEYNPKSFYFELRAKQPTHQELQHNVLFELRQKLQKNGAGDAFYTAPLFLNRSAYLLAVHLSSMLRWRPWHIFRHDPFFNDDLNIIGSTGSIRFHKCPVLSNHIVIPPHLKVTTHKHKYSYLENGKQICFHSPTAIEGSRSLGQLIYDFINFKDGIPSRTMVSYSESLSLLRELNLVFRNNESNMQDIFRESLPIDSWITFGEQLKKNYDIEQYLLIQYREG